MTTLLMRLAGPMQAWGDSSRFGRRATRAEPTKSGVLGLLAAADGRRRSDPIEDLAALRFGVRVDQPGRLLRDFQTAQSLDGARPMPLSQRYYLCDAVFLAGVEGDSGLLEGLASRLREPVFPLYLGRRSCAPSRPLLVGVRPGELEAELRAADWEAAEWFRRSQGRRVWLEMVRDSAVGEEIAFTSRDSPVSYDPQRRAYGWRDVARVEPRVVDNPAGREGLDFMGLHGGAG